MCNYAYVSGSMIAWLRVLPSTFFPLLASLGFQERPITASAHRPGHESSVLGSGLSSIVAQFTLPFLHMRINALTLHAACMLIIFFFCSFGSQLRQSHPSGHRPVVDIKAGFGAELFS